MILELARRRKTVRKFADNKVRLEDILYCLNVAREAPSGMNAQPWRFVIVADEELKAKIREI
ncbi:MAG TPA: nitroreductase family protein, partial [Thermoplasmatales archaeon]|nr:nitroreductase family protein [Thermoplasmatales archaeon]